MNRRQFHLMGAGALGFGATNVQAADDERDYPAPKFKPSFKKPQLSKILVQDFVIFAHSEFDMVKKLLEKEPMVLNAAMDWGAGDWETALGGASHMGRRDIVEYLLEKGARIDIFAAAMLGQLEVVKTLLTAYPALKQAKGPHGMNLPFHAHAGGKQAEPVRQYLESLGLQPVPKPPENKNPPKDKEKQ